MDKKAWIVITLCVIALFAWTSHRAGRQAEERREAEKKRLAEESEKEPEKKSGEDSGTPGKNTTGEDPEKPETAVVPVEKPAKSAVLLSPAVKGEEETQRIKLHMTSRGGGIAEVELGDGHRADLGKPEGLHLNRESQLPIGMFSRALAQLEPLDYELVEASDKAVIFETTTGDEVKIRKTYRFSKGDKSEKHLIDLTIEFTNLGAGAKSLDAWSLYTGVAAPVHWRETPDNIRVNWFEDDDFEEEDVGWFSGGWFSSEQDLFTATIEDFRWGGVSSQFYTSLIIPKEKQSTKVWATRTPLTMVDDEGEKQKAWAIQAGIGLPKIELSAKDAAGSSKVLNYQIYVGPKEYDLLVGLDNELVAVLDYGFFTWISRLLMWLMTALNGLSGSWGIAIIIITFIIRIVIWPLHHRSTKTFKRMALLNPLMKDIREKHADNSQRMNQEMMKLYKEYGVNPLGGCFPLLLQIPIFFGYFTMLRSAVELRHESFLWATDLSQPDTVAHLLGIPINPLPMLMGITMVIQMKMTPQTGDSTQRKIMMFMPLIFFIFCYFFPSALALYWTSQNIISIGQTWITRNLPDPVLEKRVDEEKAKAAARRSKKGSGNAPGAKKKRKR